MTQIALTYVRAFCFRFRLLMNITCHCLLHILTFSLIFDIFFPFFYIKTLCPTFAAWYAASYLIFKCILPYLGLGTAFIAVIISVYKGMPKFLNIFFIYYFRTSRLSPIQVNKTWRVVIKTFYEHFMFILKTFNLYIYYVLLNLT